MTKITDRIAPKILDNPKIPASKSARLLGVGSGELGEDK